MPRRPRYDPLGLPQQPNVVTDPAREAKIVAEFGNKVRYLVRSYQIETRLGLGKASFNTSLAALQAAVKSRAPEGPGQISAFNPWLQMAITSEARKLASVSDEERLGEEHGDCVRQAVRTVAARARVIRGAPGHLTLRRYVEALMVIIQDATGKPVMALRDRGGVYDPQLPGLAGAAIRQIVDAMEPRIGDPKLSYWIRQARRRYAGEWPTFEALFPGYAIANVGCTPVEALQGAAPPGGDIPPI